MLHNGDPFFMTDQKPIHVVLIEDDDALGPAVAAALQLEGMEVSLFAEAASALTVLSNDFPGVVVSDVRLPGMDGIALFAHLRELDTDLPIILTTGHGDVAMAVTAMKDGAADFLTKPFSSTALIRAITIAAERRRLVLENRKLREALKQQAQVRFIGSSDFAVRLRGTLSAVAQADVDVIVEGTAGTGKTFVARLIHELGPRHNRPFVAIDAGTLTHQDAELLLFGREPGRGGLSRTGLIERANGGTLLIDEIESASAPLQARLLSTLATRSILPVGAERHRKLSLCVAVTRQIHERPGPAEGSVNLFHQRLSAVTLTMAPLADRRDDIPALFHHFLTRHESQLGLPHRAIADNIWHHLQTHDWAGNLRELEAFAQAWAIGLNIADHAVQRPADGCPLHVTMAEFERTVLENALRAVGGNVLQLEQTLETPRKTLYDKLQRYGLRPRDFRQS
jgi:two-component system, NtrC family, C4-dicarboxylate transport response regulator DctD